MLPTYIGDESTLEKSEKGSTGKEGRSSLESVLSHTNCRPEGHLCRNPPVRSYPFANQLRGKFRAEERELENGVSQIIV